MADPVEIVTLACRQDRAIAIAALDALHEAGWRIVRTEPCPNLPQRACRCPTVQIAAEWTPEGGDDAD